MTVINWLDEVQKAEKRESEWREKAKLVVERYRDERNASNDNDTRYNILWSNTETLKPALYSNTPKPIVDRRHKDRDPVGLEASKIIERALEYHLDCIDFDGEMKSAVEDYLLPARAVARVKYEPTYGEEETPEGKAPFNPVVYEKAVPEYVHWRDFLNGPGRRWSEVEWVAFKAYMDRDELVERFGEIGNKIPLDYKIEEEDSESQAEEKATIYEIWDKKNKQVRWLAKEYKESMLEEGDPPLNFDGFYPCPKPLYAGHTNDTIIPIPLYVQYQDQAQELDQLTKRIALLTEALKVSGVYDGSIDGLQQLVLDGCENKLIPVDNWPSHVKGGGINGAIDFLPIGEVATVLLGLYEAREKVKQDLYEITGMSDIIRGTVDPREKMGQSRLKAQYATLRISDRQKEVARFARDMLQLMSEVIAEEFSPQTLTLMTGLEVPEQVIRLLRDDPIRNFRIDLETDSTIEPDQQMEKQARIEFLTAAGSFLDSALVIGEKAPKMTPLLGEMLLFGVKGFGVSRDLEGAFEEAMQSMQSQPETETDMEGQQEAMERQAETKLKAQETAGKQEIEKGKLILEDKAQQLEVHKQQHAMAMKEKELTIKEQEVSIKQREQAVKEAELTCKFNEQEQDKQRELEENEEMKSQDMQALQQIVETSQATAQAAVESSEAIAQAMMQQAKAIMQISAQMTAPKELVRDEKGKAVGVRTVLDS